jgi:hypothetical protein
VVQDLVRRRSAEDLRNESLEEDEDTLDDIRRKLSAHFNPVIIVRLKILKFRSVKQEQGESFEEFVSRLREAASSRATSPMSTRK